MHANMCIYKCTHFRRERVRRSCHFARPQRAGRPSAWAWWAIAWAVCWAWRQAGWSSMARPERRPVGSAARAPWPPRRAWTRSCSCSRPQVDWPARRSASPARASWLTQAWPSPCAQDSTSECPRQRHALRDRDRQRRPSAAAVVVVVAAAVAAAASRAGTERTRKAGRPGRGKGPPYASTPPSRWEAPRQAGRSLHESSSAPSGTGALFRGTPCKSPVDSWIDSWPCSRSLLRGPYSTAGAAAQWGWEQYSVQPEQQAAGELVAEAGGVCSSRTASNTSSSPPPSTAAATACRWTARTRVRATVTAVRVTSRRVDVEWLVTRRSCSVRASVMSQCSRVRRTRQLRGSTQRARNENEPEKAGSNMRRGEMNGAPHKLERAARRTQHWRARGMRGANEKQRARGTQTHAGGTRQGVRGTTYE